MMKLAFPLIFFALATPSFTASLRENAVEAVGTAEDEVSHLMNKLQLIRKARALPDGPNGPSPDGTGGSAGVPVDAAFPADQSVAGKDDSSSNDIDSLIAALEAQIAELMAPPTTVISPAEVAAEAQEQAPQPDPSQPDPSQPDPAQPDPKGPDGSNTEDGDGDGNNGQQNGQQQQDSGNGVGQDSGNQNGNGIIKGNEDTK